MAERNLSVVANRIRGLLSCENIEKIKGSLRGVPLKLLLDLEQRVAFLAPFLLDGQEKSFVDSGVEGWLIRLEDVLYDADNLLEELLYLYILYEANYDYCCCYSRKTTRSVPLKRKVHRFIFSTMSLLVPRYNCQFKNMTNQIQDVNERLKEITDDTVGLGLVERIDEKTSIELIPAGARELTAAPSFVVRDEVCGREFDKKKIVSALLDEEVREKSLTVLAIVGMGGVGKTTLAMFVFNDWRVQRYFEPRIWVGVSKIRDVGRILEEIIYSASRTRSLENDSSALESRARELLQRKRYLLVLDDMWHIEDQTWVKLRDILQVGASGSAIILTSRLLMIADVVGANRRHVLDALSPKESRSLFARVVIGDQHSKVITDRMRCIGDKILRECRGHPLIISAIGSMLYFKNSEAEWLFFYENEFLRTVKDSDIISLLKLSYDHLPSPLKHCFAFCSLFPFGHEIDVQKLIKLWMALGFVDPLSSNDQSLEDVGYGVFLSLLHRSFFHEVTMNVRGRVTKCKMHDLMHDLATFVAGKQCGLLDSRSTIESIDRRTLHVSFVSDLFIEAKVIASSKRAGKLQSILLPSEFQREDWRLNDEIFDAIISGCRFLRVLDMHALGIKKVPYSIGKLKHLRYLDLSENEYISELPDSITELLNLQTLRLSSCFELKKLPRDIGNLINLRHLEIDGCYNLVGLPPGIGRLTNLQTLSQLVLSEDAYTRKDELNELRRLNNLRDKFEIKNLKHGEDAVAAADLGVKQVRSLSLEWESHVPEFNDETPPIRNLSSALEELSLNGFRSVTIFSSGFSVDLVKLSLRRCIGLPAFSQCLKLKVLVLDEMTDLKHVEDETLTSSTTFFPALQELWLTELPNLRGWWRTSTLSENQENLPSFPCLSKLVIEDCPKLDSVPLFPTLEEGLVLDSTCWNPFQLTMKHKAKPPAGDKASSSTSQSSTLSKLKNLCIVGIHKFNDLKADEIEWINLKSLQLLKFDSLPELTTLPEGLRQVTSLQELHVWRCGLQELPTWIVELKSLKKLVIRVCPKLETLPDEIRELEHLITMEIDDCPMLLRRCEKQIGADWDKVSHIQTLRLGRITVR